MAPPSTSSFARREGRVEEFEKGHHQLALSALCRGDHLVCFLQCERHRLLDQHMLASLERSQERRRVHVVRSGDHHGVDVLAIQHGVDISRGELRSIARLEVAGARRRCRWWPPA